MYMYMWLYMCVPFSHWFISPSTQWRTASWMHWRKLENAFPLQWQVAWQAAKTNIFSGCLQTVGLPNACHGTRWYQKYRATTHQGHCRLPGHTCRWWRSHRPSSSGSPGNAVTSRFLHVLNFGAVSSHSREGSAPSLLFWGSLNSAL